MFEVFGSYLSLIYTIMLIVLTLLIGIIIYNKYSAKTNKHKTNFNSNFQVITTYNELEPHIPQLITSKRLGIDTEYHKGTLYKGKLCLIQITSEKIPQTLIIDIISIPSKEKASIYKVISTLCSNNSIEKIFHSCYNDIDWIKDEIGCNTYNIFDTQEMHQLVNKVTVNKSLNELLKIYLGLNFSVEEKKKYQKSNWLSRPLLAEQLSYASNDSVYLIKLRDEIDKKVKTKAKIKQVKKDIENKIYNQTKKERNYSKASNYIVSNMTKCDLEIYDIVKKLFCDLYQITDEYGKECNVNIDLLLSMKTIYKLSTSLPSNETDIMNIIRQKTSLKSLSDYGDFYKKICTYVLDTTSKLSINKSDLTKITVSSEDNNELSEHKEKAIKRFACKNPVYESCKMLAPDGQQLCFCDSKKMNWYVSRNLAKVISTNPPVFKLLFEPNARGCTDENGENSNFYITERKNCCVICGSTKEYRRFHVVPLLYRQFFPVNLKSHKSHDVLLVCYLCHEKANEVYEIKKEEISKRYNVPLNIKTNEQTLTHTINTFCKKCKSLYKNWDKLPYEKREKLRSEIFNEYSNIINEYKDNEFVLKLKERGYIDKIKDENGIDLDFAVYAMNYKGKKLESIEKKSVHGKLVVEQISNLKDFIREWRKYFVDSFHPKYLSSEWSVDHEMVRTFGEHSNFHKESNSK